MGVGIGDAMGGGARPTPSAFVEEEEDISMAGSANQRDYYCDVVSEDVRVTLRTRQKGGFSGRRHKFVQCNQELCQYVEGNDPPCPLRPEMFDAEVIVPEALFP